MEKNLTRLKMIILKSFIFELEKYIYKSSFWGSVYKHGIYLRLKAGE